MKMYRVVPQTKEGIVKMGNTAMPNFVVMCKMNTRISTSCFILEISYF